MDKELVWQKHVDPLIHCRRCPRLVEGREKVAGEKRLAYRDWTYWGKPVPGFGDLDARLVLVGLAPGAHGSNRTGRMFTGDRSGDFLFSSLYRTGYANQPLSANLQDGLRMTDCFITAACRCAPPNNKVSAVEMATCLPFLTAEFAILDRKKVIVALGKVGFDAVINLYRPQIANPSDYQFSHGAVFHFESRLPILMCSFHPSPQNTNTGRLTTAMLDAVFEHARTLCK